MRAFMSYRHRSRARHHWTLAADDSGSVVPMVMGVAVVLFVVSTMLVTVAVFNTTQSRFQGSRVKALHMADAGLNSALYELRQDPTWWVATSTVSTINTSGPSVQKCVGWTTMDDGKWYVESIPPNPSAKTPLQLRCTGVIPSLNMTRTIVANVRFPTYADYFFLVNDDEVLAAGAVVEGSVRANGDTTNGGAIHGNSESHGSYSGPAARTPNMTGDVAEGVPLVDFTKVQADISGMRTAAKVSGGTGTYWADSGKVGYEVTLSGTNFTLKTVQALNSTTGARTYVSGSTVTKAIPPNGMIFFDDTVYVSGTYDAPVTIATGNSNSIYLCNNLQPTSTTSQNTCGLVADANVIIPSWFTSIPTNTIVWAAMLGSQGSVYSESHSGTDKNDLNIHGAVARSVYGGLQAGYDTREYIHDPRLNLYPPPMYPTLRDGSLHIESWIEQ
jgi:hypothetical protein